MNVGAVQETGAMRENVKFVRAKGGCEMERCVDEVYIDPSHDLHNKNTVQLCF